MIDHLYPARPGMLRRGTPVLRADGPLIGREGVGLGFDHRGLFGVGWGVQGGVWLGPPLMYTMLALDLRDVTARAHAAMPYTRVTTHCDIGPAAIIGRAGCVASPQHWRTLCRMRCMDEFVTVTEARAALDWAHEVTRAA